MTTDPVAARLRRIVALSADISARPDLGPYEVGLLEELADEAMTISGGWDALERGRRPQERWRGVAVDLPPRIPGVVVLPSHLRPARSWWSSAPDHVHWSVA